MNASTPNLAAPAMIRAIRLAVAAIARPSHSDPHRAWRPYTGQTADMGEVGEEVASAVLSAPQTSPAAPGRWGCGRGPRLVRRAAAPPRPGHRHRPAGRPGPGPSRARAQLVPPNAAARVPRTRPSGGGAGAVRRVGLPTPWPAGSAAIPDGYRPADKHRPRPARPGAGGHTCIRADHANLDDPTGTAAESGTQALGGTGAHRRPG